SRRLDGADAIPVNVAGGQVPESRVAKGFSQTGQPMPAQGTPAGMDGGGAPQAGPPRQRAPRLTALRLGESFPDSNRDQVSGRLVLLALQGSLNPRERFLLPEHADFCDERADGSLVGDVQLPRRSALAL